MRKFKGRNFMTPNIEECDFFSNGKAYEVSYDKWLKGYIAGVTVSDESLNLNKSFTGDTKREALELANVYVHQLKSMFQGE